MNWQAIGFDWNQARAFLATAEEGSLSAAARTLGQTQPTLGRQVSSLESDLGVTLFERSGRSLELTDTGIELLEHFKAMRDAATNASLAASGRAEAIEGVVTLTMTNGFATFHLPAILVELRSIAPGIVVEIVASNEVRDLTRREADIAIRHGRPDQPDLIARWIADTGAHFYASSAYLDSHGRPKTLSDLSQLDFIGFESPDRTVQIMADSGLAISRDNVRIITESGTAMLELMRHGLGITLATSDIADMYPDLERVMPDMPPIPVPVWLTTHRELHTSRRIRVVFDFLADAIAKIPATPKP